jgi:hypothetical protein
MIRCRLRARWSLPARIAFWALSGLELLLLGFVGTGLRWWMWLLSLTSLAVLIWWLRHEQRRLQSMIIVFLNGLAKEWRLTKVWCEAPTEPRAVQRAPAVREKQDKAPKLSAATGPGS